MPKPSSKKLKKAKVASRAGKRHSPPQKRGIKRRSPATSSTSKSSVGIAPPKNTGGGGFLFETRVCASFLAQMLTCEPPLEPERGMLERVDFQTKVQGWHLDDVLLTLARGTTQSRYSLSIKSNRQFVGRSAPPDFVTAAWEQFLHVGTSQFDSAYDVLGLVTAPLESRLRNALNGLVTKAMDSDPLVLTSNIAKKGWASATERSLFRSFACPKHLARSHGIAEGAVARLLSRSRFLEYDFEAVPSHSVSRAVAYCRGALRSGDTTEAEQLWVALQQIAEELRPKAGFIMRAGLLDRLRGAFALHARPDHRSDWARLAASTREAAAQVTDTIGQRVRFTRDAERAELERALEGAPRRLSFSEHRDRASRRCCGRGASCGLPSIARPFGLMAGPLTAWISRSSKPVSA